jgi:hypothetical protein
VLGLVIFAGFAMVDFQRLRRSKDVSSAPLLDASTFLDILNVFLFFLQIFSREQRAIMLSYRPRVAVLATSLTPHPSGPALAAS